MSRNPKPELLASVTDLPLLPSDLADVPTYSPPVDEEDFPRTEDAMPTEPSDPGPLPRSASPATLPMTLLDRLAADAAAEKLSSEAEWQSLVQKVATDTADESEVADMLLSSGRTIGDLGMAVDRQRKVDRLQKLINDIEPANAAQREAQADFNNLKAAQKKQTEEMQAEFRRLRSVLTTALARSSRAKNASFDLMHLDGMPEFAAPPPPDATVWSGKSFPERQLDRGSRRMATAGDVMM